MAEFRHSVSTDWPYELEPCFVRLRLTPRPIGRTFRAMSDAQLPMVDPFRPFPAPKQAYSRRRIIRTALLKALDEDMGDGTRAIDRFARSMVASAIDGSVDAAKFVTDRVDGKQLAAQELTGDLDGNAVVDDHRMIRALALLVEEMRMREQAIEVAE
jgi:hypothetical protein